MLVITSFHCLSLFSFFQHNICSIYFSFMWEYKETYCGANAKKHYWAMLKKKKITGILERWRLPQMQPLTEKLSHSCLSFYEDAFSRMLQEIWLTLLWYHSVSSQFVCIHTSTSISMSHLPHFDQFQSKEGPNSYQRKLFFELCANWCHCLMIARLLLLVWRPVTRIKFCTLHVEAHDI